MRMTRIRLAFAGITTGMLGLFAITAPADAGAAPQTYRDCRLVAPTDRTLCNQVANQLPYYYATKGQNLVGIPAGSVLVTSEVTHAGLTRREMHSALVGYAQDYALHAAPGSLILDMASMRDAAGTDAQYEAGFRDTDGKPGGKKTYRVRLDLP